MPKRVSVQVEKSSFDGHHKMTRAKRIDVTRNNARAQDVDIWRRLNVDRSFAKISLADKLLVPDTVIRTKRDRSMLLQVRTFVLVRARRSPSWCALFCRSKSRPICTR
ncbi:hypothetical protein ACOME3_008941 [Neoechinorhynchus agilis]